VADVRTDANQPLRLYVATKILAGNIYFDTENFDYDEYIISNVQRVYKKKDKLYISTSHYKEKSEEKEEKKKQEE
jgi:hypothetical protein